MAPESPAADLAQGFAPLASLLRAVGPQKLSQARQHVLRFGREELLNSYRAAFAKGQRKRAFLMAECLVNHGIPPFVWHERLALESMSVNTRYDLFLADLMWLRRWHPEHHKMVRYRRCKLMLAGDDTMSHREAEFAFYQGKRPAWKLVGSLSLTNRQQTEAAYLRSAPIKKRADITEAMSARVLEALRDDLRIVRRTVTFGESDALTTLQRRHALWRCSRMVDGKSPTEIAVRYTQLTGTPITRQAAAQQLEKVRSALAKTKVTL